MDDPWWETAGFVTCLNIDHRAPIWLTVGQDSVTLSSRGTDIEMLAESLDQLRACAEYALPRLAASSVERWPRDQAVNTQLLCDPDTPPEVMMLGDAVELDWGPLTLTMTQAVLPELIRRIRQGQAELTRRLAESPDDDSDVIIQCRRLPWASRLATVIRRLRRRIGLSGATTPIHQRSR